ncbi:hypothetical protein AWB82_07066 [Caballeronia glebae]|uniref:Uncharacterized protein n=1 Tax=Caballeronia glebae TaxID=1777143 RepID=A0A158DQ60_9BURK|nr:hypothetical protein AWB82_07066 [Caballeronia glebae]
MTVNIDDVVYTGPVVRVGSNESFGFASAYEARSVHFITGLMDRA